MDESLGRPGYSPDEGATTGTDKGQETAPAVIKIDGKEIAQNALDELINGDAAETTRVTIQGKKVTLKEMREGWKNQPNSQKVLADERNKLETEFQTRNKQLDEREKAMTETAKSASNESLNRVVDALLEASGRKARSTALTRDEKVAFVNDVMANNGWNAGVDALVRDIYDADTSAAEANKKVAELERKLADMEKKAEERDEKATQAEVLALEREEARIVKGIYPGYDANRRTRDARSMAIQGLLVDDEPDQEILGGLIGNKTAPDVIAKKVLTFYATAERDRVKAEDEAEKKRKDTEAVTTLGRSLFTLSDDLETELAKADTPKKLAEVRRKIAAAQRGKA